MIECSICKSHNEDRSLYCLECGQRLAPPQIQSLPDDVTTGDMLATPKRSSFPTRPSVKLHSPMLDAGGHMSRREEFVDIEENISTSLSGRSTNISRTGLHSPLLDGQSQSISHFSSHVTGFAKSNSGSGHLHSPVLDGPGQSIRNLYDEDVSDEDYNSLRSPLLSAKISLPEHTDLDAGASNNKAPSIESAQEMAFTSISPSTKNASANIQTEFPSISITGVNNPNKAISQPLKPLLKGQSLLPTEPPLDKRAGDENKYSSGGSISGIIITLVLAVLGFKAWYLLSLGNAIFSSTPFLFDQIGQILIALALLIFIATPKS